ncbi:hypothetical protein ES332_A11G340700v1 [Gossypium tomentosum]|uniref:Uncharacterized protein n=1 Tax=Gossypium tomentosum TaxID=34277 RepID=A0A5D2NM86_GOSTO|nr:hypothetical protein ES332_A11G340700v1 [Gossypium tomentosum]
MARLPLIVQSVRRKRIGLALTIWLQLYTVASWFLLTLGATGKDAQTAVDIIEEIDADDAATTNTHEERNDFHGCEADVSLDDVDLSDTQQQPAINQDQDCWR